MSNEVMDGKLGLTVNFYKPMVILLFMIIGSLLFVYFVITPSFILQTWLPKFSPLGGGLLDDSHGNRKIELSGDIGRCYL